MHEHAPRLGVVCEDSDEKVMATVYCLFLCNLHISIYVDDLVFDILIATLHGHKTSDLGLIKPRSSELDNSMSEHTLNPQQNEK